MAKTTARKIGRVALLLGGLLGLGAAHSAPPAQLTLKELRAKFMTPRDRIMDIGGVEVRYRDEGKGPALLLLHGSNSTLESYDGVVAQLKARYRLIRFDMPPVGLSGSVSDSALTTLPTPEALMTGILDHLAVPSVVAVGVSSGGTMAYYLAGSHPERVRALILSNTPADPVDTSGVQRPPGFDALAAEAEKTGVHSKEYWSVYMRSLYGEPSRVSPALIDRLYEMNRRLPEAHARHLYALTTNNATTLERLGKVTAPTLIIWGMRDPVLPYKAALALRDHLTAIHPSLLLLDDVGHYPTFEVPERCAAIIDDYLQKVLPSAH